MTAPSRPPAPGAPLRLIDQRVAQIRSIAGLLRLASGPSSPLRQAADELAAACREAGAVLRNPHLASDDRDRLLAAGRSAHHALANLELLTLAPGPVGVVGRSVARLRGPIGDWLDSLGDEKVSRPQAPSGAGAPE